MAACFLFLLLSALAVQADQGDFLSGEGKQVSPALARSAEEVMAEFREKAIFLVDVRPEEAFARYHIPGSLNMDFHEIRVRSFLSTKPLVLINEGFALGRLAESCEDLSKEGFQVAILAGGLVAWKGIGGPLAGDPFAMEEMHRVSPEVLASELAWTHPVIVHGLGREEAVFTLPLAHTLLRPHDPEGVQDLLTLMGEGRNNPFLAPIIITKNGEANAAFRRYLASYGMGEIYVLEKGWAGYERYLEHRRLAQRSRDERMASTGSGTSCTLQD
ncbi:rhodanese-like domain-containing protein [Desulfobotulus sp.]|uniref:rhodanese-like domain-containing protein n=1 Tax=Desulfobotulus sp. TaxID=1940337 RepID=UPI002A359166|nr:rhodanese-like domain-containing protein [Desulfobotulus sp.]MDY0164390.1 rhodanese-like domain-containing protein [Desulfobotulus sp.]